MNISDATKQKMVDKLTEQAAADGVQLGEDGETLAEPEDALPGLPNWEIEELKSITDGHILLMPPTDSSEWSWNLDPYKSIARIGMDALHPALVNIGANKIRLKMLQ